MLEDGKHELVRQDDGFIPETIILLGEGALKKTPIRDAIEASYKSIENLPIDFRKPAPTEVLAHLAMLTRSAREVIVREMVSLISGSVTNFDEMKDAFECLESVCAPFRKILAKKYQDPQAFAFDDKKLTELKKYGLGDDKTAVVTTLWGNGAWDLKELNLRNLIYLYGRCSNWETLLLPTETADEINHFQILAKDLEDRFKSSEEFGDQVRETCKKLLAAAFAPPKTQTEYWESSATHLGYAHGRALKWMREAKRLVICGLNLNSYDHELYTVLSDKIVTTAPEKWEQILLIDPRDGLREKVSGYLKVNPSLCEEVSTRSFFQNLFS